MHLNESLGRCSEIRYVCNLHEQACAIAAEAYAKYDTRLGAAMVTAGPGATNAITGVAGAWLDSSPVLFLSGQVKKNDLMGESGLRNRGVQEVDIVGLVRSITKYAVTITDPSTIRYHLEKAIHLALSGRPGPVWLDIPLDVQAAEIQPDKLLGFRPEISNAVAVGSALQVQTAEVVRMLRRSERPFILLGNGVRLAGGQRSAESLINALGVPFGLTWPAMDLFPDSHPLLVGRPGPMAPRGANFALQNSDFLLMVGARMDLVMTAFAPENLAREASKVMVDIDPAELAKFSGSLALSVCADARDFLEELHAQSVDVNCSSRKDWLSRCAEWKVKYPLVQKKHRETQDRVSMYCFTEVLSDALAEGDLIVPGSSGNAIETLLLAFRPKKNQRIFITTGLGPMGFGLPASIGGCLAHGRRRTVCVDGDGGFQMNIQELETLVRLRLPVKCFVINNGGYASMVASQKNYFGHLVGADPSSGVTLPDVTKVAAAYGIPTCRIANQADLRRQIDAVLASDGPMVVEVLALADEAREPRVSSTRNADGSMTSKPLEDMWPFLDRKEFMANMIITPVNP